MDKRPSIDRELLIPILIGGFSVVGIIVVLLVGRSLNSPAEVAATPSSTPFQYVYLGTEPAITTLVPEGSELPPTEEPVTGAPIFNTPVILPSRNATRTATSNVLFTSTPSGQPTATRTSTASAANTYDDTDTRLMYSGSWVSRTAVDGAYQKTLHISDVADDKSVTINFSGQEIHFFYQSAPSFGIVTIYLDSDPLGITLNQAQGGGEWVHMLDKAGSHTIKIAHTSGGSVNIDKFTIPAPTPTPTRTPTP